jgi:four helix bundle protein
MKQRVGESAGQQVSGSEASGRTRHYRELRVWQKSMQLAREIYSATDSFPRKETFGLTSQIRRAAVSVPCNIAEGHGRLSDGAFRVFLGHARGSLFELQTQLELALGLGYLEAKSAETLDRSCEEIARMVNGLLRSLKEDSVQA